MDTRKGLTINLAKKKGTPSLDVFIHWAITGGRFIVILTETIALGAFLYRFTLDRQIVDLHDQINQRQKIVAAFATDEAAYRNLQDRLTQMDTINKNVTITPALFSDIQELANKNAITIKLLTMNDKNLHIEFTTGSLTNLKAFINDLNKRPDISGISLDRIEDRITTAQLEAEVSCTLQTAAVQVKGLAPVPSSGEGK